MTKKEAADILLSFLDECETFITEDLQKALKTAIIDLYKKPEGAKWD